MFKELLKSKWFPIATATLSIWVFVTIEVMWMVSVKAGMGR